MIFAGSKEIFDLYLSKWLQWRYSYGHGCLSWSASHPSYWNFKDTFFTLKTWSLNISFTVNNNPMKYTTFDVRYYWWFLLKHLQRFFSPDSLQMHIQPRRLLTSGHTTRLIPYKSLLTALGWISMICWASQLGRRQLNLVQVSKKWV